MRNLAFDDLTPGLLFSYKGPKNMGVLPTFGVAQVLGLDVESGTVLVRTFFQSPDGSAVPEVGMLPIVFSAFSRSISKMYDNGAVPDDAIALIQAWRQRQRAGSAGAFRIQLWEAEERAWTTIGKTIPEASRDRCYVEYAFPKPGDDGRFNVVEVVAVPRRSSSLP